MHQQQQAPKKSCGCGGKRHVNNPAYLNNNRQVNAPIRPQNAPIRPQNAPIRPQNAPIRPQNAQIRPQNGVKNNQHKQ